MKPTTKPKTTQKRSHRTPEEIIADLEAKIESVKVRAQTKRAKADPEAKPFLAAVKALDKAAIAAGDAENQAMLRALDSARATLGTHLVEMGVRAPITRSRKCGPAKGSAA